MFKLFTLPKTTLESDLEAFYQMLHSRSSINEIEKIAKKIAKRSPISHVDHDLIKKGQLDDLPFFQFHNAEARKTLSKIFAIALITLMRVRGGHSGDVVVGTDQTEIPSLQYPQTNPLQTRNQCQGNIERSAASQDTTVGPAAAAAAAVAAAAPAAAAAAAAAAAGNTCETIESNDLFVSTANQIDVDSTWFWGEWSASRLTKAIERVRVKEVSKLIEEDKGNAPIDIFSKDSFGESGYDYLVERINGFTTGKRFLDSMHWSYEFRIVTICKELVSSKNINFSPSQYQEIYDIISGNIKYSNPTHVGRHQETEMIKYQTFGFQILNKIMDKLPENNKIKANKDAWFLMVSGHYEKEIMLDEELSREFYQKTSKYIDIDESLYAIAHGRAYAFQVLNKKLTIRPDHIPKNDYAKSSSVFVISSNTLKRTLLHRAVQEALQNDGGGYDILKQMVTTATPDMINTPDVNGCTPFMLAVTLHKQVTGVWRGNMFDMFMKIEGLDVNAIDNEGKTALSMLTDEITNTDDDLTPNTDDDLTPEADKMLFKLIQHEGIDLKTEYAKFPDEAMTIPMRLNLYLQETYTKVALNTVISEVGNRQYILNPIIYNEYEKLNAVVGLVEEINKHSKMTEKNRKKLKQFVDKHDKELAVLLNKIYKSKKFEEIQGVLNKIYKSKKLEEIQGVTLASGDFVAQIRRVSKDFVDKNRLDLDTQRTEALKQKEALRQRRRRGGKRRLFLLNNFVK